MAARAAKLRSDILKAGGFDVVELEERLLDAQGRLAKVRQKISDIRGHL